MGLIVKKNIFLKIHDPFYWPVFLLLFFSRGAFTEPAGWRPSRPLLSILWNRNQSAQNWRLVALTTDILRKWLWAAQRPLRRAPVALQSRTSDTCRCQTRGGAEEHCHLVGRGAQMLPMFCLRAFVSLTCQPRALALISWQITGAQAGKITCFHTRAV